MSFKIQAFCKDVWLLCNGISAAKLLMYSPGKLLEIAISAVPLISSLSQGSAKTVLTEPVYNNS